MPDEMTPAMRHVLEQFRRAAHSMFDHRRGCDEARDYANVIERGYGSDPDPRVREEIASICRWLRAPKA
jgi:hypothetical protein